MKIFVALLAALYLFPIGGEAATYHIDPSFTGEVRNGSLENPFFAWSEATIASNNTYLQKRGTLTSAAVNIYGKSDIGIDVYGEGSSPARIVTTDDACFELVASHRITVSGYDCSGATNAAIAINGSEDFIVRNNLLHDSHYGLTVTKGKYGTSGLVENNYVWATDGDGIGAWNLSPAPTIRGNVVSAYGNDGIDVLGSFCATVEGNRVIGSYGRTGVRSDNGIKAGGNPGSGGGGNRVLGNYTEGSSNYGIYGRNAIGNIYLDNVSHRNGVNFHLAADTAPTMPTIIGNVSTAATHEMGMDYDVHIPPPADVAHASGNSWSHAVLVRDTERYTDQTLYRAAMAPWEEDSTLTGP